MPEPLRLVGVGTGEKPAWSGGFTPAAQSVVDCVVLLVEERSSTRKQNLFGTLDFERCLFIFRDI